MPDGGDALDRRLAQRLFFHAAVSRLAAIAVLVAIGGSVSHMSRDSVQYHERGLAIAEQYAAGDIVWSRWIDEGWNEFIGVVYYLFVPNLLLISAINIAFCGLSGILIYKIAIFLSGRRGVAYASALVFVWFPSGVYYTVCPLKEAPAICGLLCVVWGTCVLIDRRRLALSPWIVAGLLIIAMLRVYLVPVCIGCIVVSLLPARLAGGMRGTIQLVLAVGVLFVLVLVSVDILGIKYGEWQVFEYYDLDRVNYIRADMSYGRTAMFDDPDSAHFGNSITNDIWLGAKGLLFFLFTIDPTDITRTRQMAALPEMLFFVFCLPCLFVGVRTAWRIMPNRVLPIILFGAVLVLVYSTAATNAGAMYRWRLQALPFLLMLIVYGAAVRRRGAIYALLRPFGIESWKTSPARR